MKKIIKRVIPATLAMSLAVTPVVAQAAEFKPSPGNPYAPEVMAKLEDNVMEYGEIEMLIDTYNTTLKNLKDSYGDSKNSMKDIEKVKEQVYDGSEQLLDASYLMADSAESMRQMVGFELSSASLKEILNGIKNNYGSGNAGINMEQVKDQIMSGINDFQNSSVQIPSLSEMLESLTGEDIQVTTVSIAPSTYAELVYNSVLLENQAEQILLTADQLTEMSPEMMKIQMIDSPRAMMISGAQSMLIAYENIRVQKEVLLESIALAEAGLQTTERMAAVGMGTLNNVYSTKQGVAAAKSGLVTLEANEVNLRQQLCNMLGWAYDASPEIPAIPAPDMSRIDAMNLEADTQTAINNNFTLKYNRLSEDTLTDGSVQMENLHRTLKAEEAEIATSMVSLYNSVLQARSEYYNAQTTQGLELTNLMTAERKLGLGLISSMEYLQQKNTYKSAETNVRVAELNLLQTMETYDWAVKGNLTLSQ
ncbi:MAG: hypothetical protein IJ374_06990 [Lachnospiraceae bacterium]|nr:hypothetical protein [Lachnospiraceae bacterium]